MNTPCAAISRDLGPFVDGELRGPAMLRVLQHLRACTACADRADEMRQIGDMLRCVAVNDAEISTFAGLASTVVSRARAEEHESWLGMFRRAREDWHWLMVGAGSVAATMMVTTTVSVLLAFGPKPQRDDSLAAIGAEIIATTPSGYLFVDASPVGTNRQPELLQVDNGSPPASAEIRALASREAGPEEMIRALFDATHKRHAPAFEHMSLADSRRAAENLSTEITRQMMAIGASPGSSTIEVSRIRLVASSRVVMDNGS